MILLGSVTGVGAAERAPDTMAERVRACAPCHGTQGEGTKDPYFPRLAGKPAGERNGPASRYLMVLG
jgi:cytochrome c553